MKKQLLYLTGFMGSGKSTIGPIVANTLGWQFIDLDKEIEEIEKISVSKIFETKGEKYFRELETKVLLEVSQKKEFVVSLGGGTIINEDNLRIIKNSGMLIYLKLSVDSAYKRLKFKKDRPLFSNIESLSLSKHDVFNKIASLMAKRTKYYEQADETIETDSLSIGAAVDKIVKIFNKENKNKI